MPEIPVEFKMKFDLAGAKAITREIEKWKKLRKEMGGFGGVGGSGGGGAGGIAGKAIAGGAIGAKVAGGGFNPAAFAALAAAAKSMESAADSMKESAKENKKTAKDTAENTKRMFGLMTIMQAFQSGGGGVLKGALKLGAYGTAAAGAFAAYTAWEGADRLDRLEQISGVTKSVPGKYGVINYQLPDRNRFDWAFRVGSKYGVEGEEVAETYMKMKRDGIINLFRGPQAGTGTWVSGKGADRTKPTEADKWVQDLPTEELPARLALGLADRGVKFKKFARTYRQFANVGSDVSYADFESLLLAMGGNVFADTGFTPGQFRDLETGKAKSITDESGNVTLKSVDEMKRYLAWQLGREGQKTIGSPLLPDEERRGVQDRRATIDTHGTTALGSQIRKDNRLAMQGMALAQQAEEAGWTRQAIYDKMSAVLKASFDLTAPAQKLVKIVEKNETGWDGENTLYDDIVGLGGVGLNDGLAR